MANEFFQLLVVRRVDLGMHSRVLKLSGSSRFSCDRFGVWLILCSQTKLSGVVRIPWMEQRRPRPMR